MEHLIINRQEGKLYNVLNTVKELTSKELDILLLQIKKIRVKNYPIINTKQEAELLQLINMGLVEKEQKRYKVLLQKRINENLTKNEYTELLIFTEKIEGLQEKRLENMISLAKIRNISLSKLAKQLELKSDLYVV